MTLYECLKTQSVNTVTLHRNSKNLVTYPYKESTHDVGNTHFIVSSDGGIKVQGAADGGTTAFTVSKSITLTPNTQYVLSGYREGNPDSYMVLRDTATKSQVIQLTKVNQTQTFTAQHTTYELYIQLDSNIITVDYDLYYPQLEEGIVATDYELAPADQNLEKVIYSSRNLLAPSTSGSAKITGIQWTNNGDGTITASGTATANSTFAIGSFGPVNKVVTLSGKPPDNADILLYAVDTVTMKSFNVYDESKSFNSVNKVNVYARVLANTTVNNIVFKPQIEVGDTATDFVPYKQETVWEVL